MHVKKDLKKEKGIIIMSYQSYLKDWFFLE